MNYPGPTLRSELRRGVNAYNLTVGALAGAALGLGFAFLPEYHLGLSATSAGVLFGLAWFMLLTAVHTAMHGYFGWRFENGIRAAHEGRPQAAVRLLQVVEQRGMDHYDIDGEARKALQMARQAC